MSLLGRAFAWWAVYRCAFRGGFPGLVIGDGRFDCTVGIRHRLVRDGYVALEPGEYVISSALQLRRKR